MEYKIGHPVKDGRIACHEGRCWEDKGGRISFSDLFEDSSITGKIEKDLWRKNFFGN